MFEKIVLRRSFDGPSLTVGEIAEALLFYQNVHIVFDWGTVSSLLPQIGTSGFLSLLNRRGVTGVYCEENLGTYTEQTPLFPSHKFIEFAFAGSQEVGTIKDPEQKLVYLIKRLGIDNKPAKKLVRRFIEKIPTKKLSSDHFIQGGITRSATEDLTDEAYIKEAIGLVVKDITKNPILPPDFFFRIIPDEHKFRIETNLNFDEITRKSGLKEKMTEASLINNILEAKADIIMAGHYGGEFQTSSLSSNIVRLRHQYLLKRIAHERAERESFVEIAFSEGRCLKEAINKRERSFDEFLKLLDQSDRFKEWIATVNPDEKLIKAYFEASYKEGWINSLPAKGVRYVINLVSGSNPFVGAAVGAADTFIVEKLFNGWRPNHFVAKKIDPFLQTNRSE